ncbi:uncharacterized protein LOC133292048 isoform X2 [Gastrolobium bilobum]|uniref:uncharacterized protein LOC133292048 isoform X2 n=1 Tax=Gastrolobium bilobum TaxID=150636 RepID=UPI002AB25006|nr:uncharacterized protein LOC133292048 isoform X2 [Gastrolobium bilobum]
MYFGKIASIFGRCHKDLQRTFSLIFRKVHRGPKVWWCWKSSALLSATQEPWIATYSRSFWQHSLVVPFFKFCMKGLRVHFYSMFSFLVIRDHGFTEQCLVEAQPDSVSPQMVKYTTTLSLESIVDIEGVVSILAEPIRGGSSSEKKLYCINRAVPNLVFSLEDAARSEMEIEKALQVPWNNLFVLIRIHD